MLTEPCFRPSAVKKHNTVGRPISLGSVSNPGTALMIWLRPEEETGLHHRSADVCDVAGRTSGQRGAFHNHRGERRRSRRHRPRKRLWSVFRSSRPAERLGVPDTSRHWLAASSPAGYPSSGSNRPSCYSPAVATHPLNLLEEYSVLGEAGFRCFIVVTKP